MLYRAGRMRVFIGLGGNLGEPRDTFASTAAELRRIGQVVRASSLYRTAPRDMLEQEPFLNAAIEVETELEPRALLQELKRVELALGRNPDGIRFGPRVVDLDVLSLDGRCVEDLEVGLIVPHPRLVERRFALEPLAELAPGLRPWRNCADVRRDVTVLDLLPSVADQEVQRVGGPDWADPSPRDWTRSAPRGS
jgi:2-amino-4-hydroxy-6-hydroxymethyldihydropteridine diphosphokinase